MRVATSCCQGRQRSSARSLEGSFRLALKFVSMQKASARGDAQRHCSTSCLRLHCAAVADSRVDGGLIKQAFRGFPEGQGAPLRERQEAPCCSGR